jgi:hypothetical protein
MCNCDVTTLHVTLHYTYLCFDVRVICKGFDNKVIFILCPFHFSLYYKCRMSTANLMLHGMDNLFIIYFLYVRFQCDVFTQTLHRLTITIIFMLVIRYMLVEQCLSIYLILIYLTTWFDWVNIVTYTPDTSQRPRNGQLYDRLYWVLATLTSVFTARSAKLHPNSNNEVVFCVIHGEKL